MSNFAKLIKTIAGLEKQLGIKFANVDEVTRALAKERAIKADLPDVVFHGSPHAFEDFKVGQDYFRHVATDPRVAAQRVKDLNIPVEERKFNLTSKQAKKMGFSPEDIKKGIILELRTKLGNPLTVRDQGTFSLSGLLQDPAVQKILDPEDLKILQSKSSSIDDRWLDSEAFSTPDIAGMKLDAESQLVAKKLAEDLAKEEQEGIYLLGQALKKKGYDSLRYRNTAEILPEYKDLHKAYLELDKKQIEINRLLSQESDPKKITEYNKLQKQLNKSLQKLESNFPESYALFPNTPVRHITAEMDPAKLKSEPGSLSKNIAIATGAGTAASTMMPEESEAAIVTKLDDVAKILSKPFSRDMSKVLKENAAREAFKAEFNVPVAHGTSMEQVLKQNQIKGGLINPDVFPRNAVKFNNESYMWIDPKTGTANQIEQHEIPMFKEFEKSTGTGAAYGEGVYSAPRTSEGAQISDYQTGFGQISIPLKLKGNKVFNFSNTFNERYPELVNLIPSRQQSINKLSQLSRVPQEEILKLIKENRIDELNTLLQTFPEHFESVYFDKLFKTFNNKNLRSPFAKFDPAMKDSADFMAGIAGVGLLGGAAASSDEANAFETPEPRLMSSEKQARLEELRRKRGIK